MGFASFLVRRILLGIVVLWFVTVATFLLFFVAPQDPARLLAGKNTTAAQIANINRRLGLDQPLIVQYWHYLDRLLHGDLGTSYFTGTSVNTILKQDLPPTLSLLVGGVVLWLIVGISVGILSRHPGAHPAGPDLHHRRAHRDHVPHLRARAAAAVRHLQAAQPGTASTGSRPGTRGPRRACGAGSGT